MGLHSKWGVLLLRLDQHNPMKSIPPERREAIARARPRAGCRRTAATVHGLPELFLLR
jgi:hypothetical protein